MEDSIREGFLCPICLKDLKSPTHLSTHFEEFHSDDKDVLQQLRSVFGKAKRKLLKDPVSELDDHASTQERTVFVSHGTPATGGIDLALWDVQTIGQTHSHSNIFRQRRKETIERCVVETNKLLIRLDKLIKSGIYASDSSLPNAVKTRKNVEKTIVPWENDNSYKFCPNCSKKFSLTFRKHHCRLCGRVICEKCIGTFDLNLACELLKLDKTTASMYVKLKRSDVDDTGLKICDPCHLLLLRQNKLNHDKHANTMLLQLYERMQMAMREAEVIQPGFLKMADSVSAGESDYGLDVAMETRVKLLKCYETVEALRVIIVECISPQALANTNCKGYTVPFSKRILSLGLEKEPQPHPQILKLQRSIRAYGSNYLVDNMFTLPALPTQDQYAEMQQSKKRERDKIKALKKQQQQTHVKKPISNTSIPPPNISNNNSLKAQSVVTDSIDGGQSSKSFLSKDTRPVFQAVSISKKQNSGWGPVQVSTDHTSDPIVQQIANIKGYIQQAIKDRKYDEVEMFEQNLKELEMIYLQERKE